MSTPAITTTRSGRIIIKPSFNDCAVENRRKREENAAQRNRRKREKNVAQRQGTPRGSNSYQLSATISTRDGSCCSTEGGGVDAGQSRRRSARERRAEKARHASEQARAHGRRSVEGFSSSWHTAASVTRRRRVDFVERTLTAAQTAPTATPMSTSSHRRLHRLPDPVLRDIPLPCCSWKRASKVPNRFSMESEQTAVKQRQVKIAAKRKRSSMASAPTSCRALFVELESRWRAICTLAEKKQTATKNKCGRGRKPSTGLVFASIAKANKVCPRTIRRWKSRCVCGSMLRRAGSGAKRTVTTDALWEFIYDKIVSSNGAVTVRQMETLAKEEFSDKCSRASLFRMMKEKGMMKKAIKVTPALKANNMRARVEWCESELDRMTNKSKDEVTIHIDEKWFQAFNTKRRGWVLSEEEPPRAAVASKLHVQKVMVFCAVANPHPEHHFDGKVFIKFVCDEHVLKSGPNKGNTQLRDVAFTKDLFVDYMIECIDAAVITMPWEVKLRFQFDNAPGHGGGRGNCKETVIPQLDEYVANATELLGDMLPQIEFVTQPPHSPDLNILDSGAWVSMECSVDHARAVDITKQLSRQELIQAMKNGWDNWASTEPLTRLFKHLPLVMNQVIKASGGNFYKAPHSRDSSFI